MKLNLHKHKVAVRGAIAGLLWLFAYLKAESIWSDGHISMGSGLAFATECACGVSLIAGYRIRAALILLQAIAIIAILWHIFNPESTCRCLGRLGSVKHIEMIAASIVPLHYAKCWIMRSAGRLSWKGARLRWLGPGMALTNSA